MHRARRAKTVGNPGESAATSVGEQVDSVEAIEGGQFGGGGVSRRRASVVSNLISYGTTVFLLLTLNFFLPRLLPGDPLSAVVTEASTDATADEATRRAVARYYRLDLPLIDQYGHYLRGLIKGDLGVSIRFNQPVTEVIGQRIGWTVLLTVTALVLATLVASVAGIHSGWRRGRRVDRGLITFFLSVRSIPPFFLASMVVFVMSVKLGWFPLGGAETAFSQLSLIRRVGDIAHHLALPVLVMAIQIGAFQFLLMRSSMVTEAGADYILLGRAKGLSDRRLKYSHAARNALLPPITQVAAQLGFALTGALLIETVFAYPGMGRLLFDSIGARDYPAIQGCFLVLTVGVVGVNLLADLAYAKLDPRTAQ